jgi:hypothetical protein
MRILCRSLLRCRKNLNLNFSATRLRCLFLKCFFLMVLRLDRRRLAPRSDSPVCKRPGDCASFVGLFPADSVPHCVLNTLETAKGKWNPSCRNELRCQRLVVLNVGLFCQFAEPRLKRKNRLVFLPDAHAEGCARSFACWERRECTFEGCRYFINWHMLWLSSFLGTLVHEVVVKVFGLSVQELAEHQPRCDGGPFVDTSYNEVLFHEILQIQSSVVPNGWLDS